MGHGVEIGCGGSAGTGADDSVNRLCRRSTAVRLTPCGEASAATWSEPTSPRIWRDPHSHFGNDEPLQAGATYTDASLARIAEEGFTGVWLFGSLYDMMKSGVLPELNRPDAERRIASVQAVVERAREHGLGVYLYFNEPMGVAEDHALWRAHPDLRGVRHWNKHALCWAAPETRAFLREAAGGVLGELPALAGVILITAGEDVTHCWSKRVRRSDGAGCECPRCTGLEPAEIVIGQLQAWMEAAAERQAPCRVLAWNWEWAYWYPEPHAPIVDRLPAGAELLLDLEFGGERPWRGRSIPIGEYSIGYAGPGRRFVTAAAHARRLAIPVHAKIEINVSHELATVPNVPLLPNVHGKLKALTEHGAAGFLGGWAIGTSFTLNTYAVKLFLRDPARFLDRDVFLDRLARDYFGLRETACVRRAWSRFCDAFQEYPFTTAMLYHGPQNDAPARALSLRYEGVPACASWVVGPLGDDLGRCFGGFQGTATPFTPEEVVDGFSRLSELWAAALPDYEAALADDPDCSAEQRRRRREESDCARMTGLQLASTANVLAFFLMMRARIEALKLTPPCDVPPTRAMLATMDAELANAERALPLVERDARLGFHQSCQGYKYDAAAIRRKIAAMAEEVSSHRPRVGLSSVAQPVGRASLVRRSRRCEVGCPSTLGTGETPIPRSGESGASASGVVAEEPERSQVSSIPRMTPRERLLAPFKGIRPDRPAWVADLTYWHDAARRAATLSARYHGVDGLLRLHADLGVCAYYVYDGNTLFASRREGIECRTEETLTRRVTRWRTPCGEVEETWEYVPEAFCWAHTRYAVNTVQDLKALQAVFRRTRFEPAEQDYVRLRDAIGDAGVALCAAPRSPLPALMADWCGVVNTIFLIEDERAAVEDTLAIISEANTPAFDIMARGPAELFHFCDNLDSGNCASLFDRYMRDEYARRLDRLHAAGRYAVVHLDGAVRGLLPRLAACGFDGVESLTPQPVGDVAIEELRSLAGNSRTILWGGIPGAMFAPPWRAEDVRSHLLRLLDAHGRDGRLIVGSADQIPPNGDIRFCRMIADTIEAWQ